MQRLAYSGHALICMVLAACLLLQPQPDLETIRNILAKAVKCGSDGAKYLKIILDVLATRGLFEVRIFSAFSNLLFHKQLSNYRRIIMHADDLH